MQLKNLVGEIEANQRTLPPLAGWMSKWDTVAWVLWSGVTFGLY
jgi:hypothetical protein